MAWLVCFDLVSSSHIRSLIPLPPVGKTSVCSHQLRHDHPILGIEGNSSFATDMSVWDGMLVSLLVNAYRLFSNRREGDKTPDMGT